MWIARKKRHAIERNYINAQRHAGLFQSCGIGAQAILDAWSWSQKLLDGKVRA